VNNLDILHIFQPIVILFALLGLYVISHSALYIFPGSILKFVIIIFFGKNTSKGEDEVVIFKVINWRMDIFTRFRNIYRKQQNRNRTMYNSSRKDILMLGTN